MLLWGDSAKRKGGRRGVRMRGEGMLDLLPYNDYRLDKESRKPENERK